MHLLYSPPVYMCTVLLCQDTMKWHEFCGTFPDVVPCTFMCHCYKFCTSKPFFIASCNVFVVNLDVLMMVVHTVGVHHNTVLVLRTLIQLSLQHLYACAYQVGTISIAGTYRRRKRGGEGATRPPNFTHCLHNELYCSIVDHIACRHCSSRKSHFCCFKKMSPPKSEHLPTLMWNSCLSYSIG